jgi:hypothetical protein
LGATPEATHKSLEFALATVLLAHSGKTDVAPSYAVGPVAQEGLHMTLSPEVQKNSVRSHMGGPLAAATEDDNNRHGHLFGYNIREVNCPFGALDKTMRISNKTDKFLRQASIGGTTVFLGIHTGKCELRFHFAQGL